MSNLLFLNLSVTEIIIIALCILLLFGGKKIPELMKGALARVFVVSKME